MVGTRYPSPPDRNPQHLAATPFGQVGEPSALLTCGIESAMAPGGQDGFREATLEKERRRAPHRGEVVPTEGSRYGGERAGVGTAPRRPRPPAAPHRSCHSRATSKGQPRYRADNHGHFHPTVELFVLAGPARTHPANMPDKPRCRPAGGARSWVKIGVVAR